MLPATPAVSITQKVFDFMMIEVQHNDITSTYSYAINTADNQLVRKGNFKGQMVQLRLSNVPEGLPILLLLQRCFGNYYPF